MQARFHTTRPKQVVEIGTSYGYSGLWIAAALGQQRGRLITIDSDGRKAQAALANFSEAKLDHLIEIRIGAALDVLPLIEGPVDFVLNDADKENCVRYIELLYDKLPNGAVVLTDNTHSHPDQLADFLAWVRKHPGFHSVDVPIGNGMELSVRVETDA